VADPQRLEELRRRVQKDPASLAFAQLAEECRRAGQHQEAVRVCRTGLAHHPDYLSARVTLGRALLALEHLDQAGAELAGVLRIAPENLAALRGLADVYQRRGLIAEALEYYRRALALAPHDHEIHAAIEALRHQPVPPVPPPGPPAAPLEVASVSGPVEPAVEGPEVATAPCEPPPSVGVELAMAPPAQPGLDPAVRAATIHRLERWLSAIEHRAEAARVAR
jgi:tetratricopeptide (TPR) repeat protein